MKHSAKLLLILFVIFILSACSMQMMNHSSQPQQNNQIETKDVTKNQINTSDQTDQKFYNKPVVAGEKISYEIIAQKSTQEVVKGKSLNFYTYNGSVPGQEIRVNVGQQVEINLKNELSEPITIHWHGYPVPIDMDGVAGVTQNGIEPGETFRYSFKATIPGTYWYHSHFNSAEQVDQGLYGAFIVEDEEQFKLDRDYTLILDEMNSKGKVGSKGNMMGMMMDVSNYDLFAVNGKSAESIPAYEIETGENVRLRFINAGYMTHYMHLGSIQYKVVAIDGQSITDPTIVQNQLLAIGPGERYDIEFTAPDGSFFVRDMLNDPAAKNLVIPLKNSTSKQMLAEEAFDGIFSLTETRLVTNYPSLESETIDKEYKMVLSHGMKGMGMVYTINGKTYPDIDPLDVKKGDVVKVILENRDPMFDHPMHLHGHFFQVLSKNDKPIKDSTIFKDTLLIKPGEKYEVSFIANNPGAWMFHCHDLNHASAGMMTSVHYEGYTIPSHIDPTQAIE